MTQIITPQSAAVTACNIQQLYLEFSNKTIFRELQFSLAPRQISACIGRNGLGKSLLMQILHFQHESKLPYEGQISWHMPHAYLPQIQRIEAATIADALGIKDLHQAFERIESGGGRFEDFDLVENKWHMPAERQSLLTQAKLPQDLNFLVDHLSEGQKTKLALCALFLKPDHYLLLDEPGNHLDAASRAWFIERLQAHPAGALVISHDRSLLEHVQHIYALSEHGIQHISGNYSDYTQHYAQHYDALERRADQQKRELKQLKVKQHEHQMKAQKRERSGKQLRASNSQAPILLDFKKEQAGQSLASVQKQQQKQMDDKQAQFRNCQMQLEHLKQQQFHFQHHAVKTGEIIRIHQLSLPHGTSEEINFAMSAGSKVNLQGANGSGKSTLLKILHKSATSSSVDKQIFTAVQSLYLDQNFNCLAEDISVLDTLHQYNADIPAEEWRNQLGQLRIRGDKAEQPMKALSGGEKLKVALLGLNFWAKNIELLLLDEPENHLDIESRELLAQAIRQYSGAVILVSHDSAFVEQCGITNTFHIGV